MKKSFVLYLDQYEPVKNLSVEQKGLLFDAMFLYNCGKEIDITDPLIAMAFSFFKQTFDRDTSKWLRKAEKNRENGKKGGRPKNNKNGGLPTNPKNPDGLSKTQNNPPEPKKAVSGTVSVTDTDSVTLVLVEETTVIKKFVTDFQNYILDKFGNLSPKITDLLIADGIYIIDELIKLDGFTFDEISKALKWAADDEFWSKNVKSLGALRAEGKNGTSKFVNMYTAYKEDDIQKLNPAEKRLQANMDVSRRFLDE